MIVCTAFWEFKTLQSGKCTVANLSLPPFLAPSLKLPWSTEKRKRRKSKGRRRRRKTFFFSAGLLLFLREMGCSGTGGLSSSSSWLVQNPWEKRGRGERGKKFKKPSCKKRKRKSLLRKIRQIWRRRREKGEKSFGNFLFALAFMMQPLHDEILLQKSCTKSFRF